MVRENMYKGAPRHKTPRECIETQLKECKIVECYYDFIGNDSVTNPYECEGVYREKPEKMLEIATKQFNKAGWVVFDGRTEKNAVFSIGCYDEKLYNKYKNRYTHC